MLRNRLLYLACILLPSFVPSECRSGQTIRVRVIDAKDGKPLKNEAVTVQFLYEGRQPVPNQALLYLQTDKNGQAVFNLPESAPMRLDARAKLKSECWHCGCWALADTKDVVQKGFSNAEPTQVSRGLKVEPGEILFVARRCAWWERIVAPLVKWAG